MSTPTPADSTGAANDSDYNPISGTFTSKRDFEPAAWVEFSRYTARDARRFADAAWDKSRNNRPRRIVNDNVEEARMFHTPGRAPTARTYAVRAALAIVIMVSVAIFENGVGELRGPSKAITPDLILGFILGALALILEASGRLE